MLQQYSVHFHIYSWFMKCCHPKLASAGVIAAFPVVTLVGANNSKYVSVAHLRANSQVESINGLIIDGVKKRIFDETIKKEGEWITELPLVVWGLRTIGIS